MARLGAKQRGNTVTPAKLELREIAAGYDGFEVLRDVSLVVREGELVSILGPSGSGKSTLFSVLIGAVSVRRGELLVDGRQLRSPRAAFAYMPQTDALMPWRRLIDNLTLGLEVQGVARRDARRRVLPLLDPFGLRGFERAYPRELSGGMRQRAALLRTVVQERQVMLLDEPFGALDALTRASLHRWIQEMHRQLGWTVLLVTHDVGEAALLSDRVYVLSPRPATVVREIKVDVPGPRTAAAAELELRSLELDLLSGLLGASEPNLSEVRSAS